MYPVFTPSAIDSELAACESHCTLTKDTFGWRDQRDEI